MNLGRFCRVGDVDRWCAGSRQRRRRSPSHAPRRASNVQMLSASRSVGESLTHCSAWTLSRVAQPFRLTISLIQIGANGEVQPLETG